MAITTELTRRLGLAAPVLSAPMALVAGGDLAAAVSRAGGLGFIGGGYGDRAWLERELAAAGDEAVGIGFITWSLQRNPDLLDLALDPAPKAVFLSFGELAPFAERLKAAGVPLIAQVQSVADARAAVRQGADIVVAQGTEAGGHGSTRATMALLPAVLDAVGEAVPVVAAGGIADGRGLAACLVMGAAAVLSGTAFYAAAESLAHPAFKARAIGASGDETVRSSVFDAARRIDWPKPWTLRTLQNSFHARFAHDPTAIDENEAATFQAAMAAGDADTGAVIVGEAVDLVRQVEPAAHILARMVEEAEARLAAAPTYCAVSP